MKPTGYSGTPLAKKLGIKENFKIKLVHQPDYYFDLFSDLPNVTILKDTKTKKDFIHYFTKNGAGLYKELPQLKNEMETNGMIWVSWYKKSSQIKTDVTEDIIRDAAFKNGLVDIKVCAIDEYWSALKLVIPLSQRK